MSYFRCLISIIDITFLLGTIRLMSLKIGNITLTGDLVISNQKANKFELSIISTVVQSFQLSTQKSKKLIVNFVRSSFKASYFYLKSKSSTKATITECSFSGAGGFSTSSSTSTDSATSYSTNNPAPDAEVNGGIHFLATTDGNHVVEVDKCRFRDYRQVKFEADLPSAAVTVYAKDKKVSFRLLIKRSYFTENVRAIDLSLLGKGKVLYIFIITYIIISL